MGRLKETRVATADVVWSKRTGTSAFDLMCGPVKTRGTGAISASLSLSLSIVGFVCFSLFLSQTIHKASSSPPPPLGPGTL